MRETIIWIIFCLVIAVAAFSWGYIYKDYRVDDLRERVHKVEIKYRDHDGRLASCETVLDRITGKHQRPKEQGSKIKE